MGHPYGRPAPAAVTLSGPALHTGVTSTVRMVRREEDGAGIRFNFPGFSAPLAAHDLSALARSARRATVLTDAAGNTIRTPEHLLAAALFFAEEPFDVTCDADEPPGLDGSARPWFDRFAELSSRGASQAGRIPRCREYATNLTWSHAGREGSLEAEPAPGFSVSYTLERGSFRESFRLESSSAVPSEILPARTFIFWQDWRALSGEKSLLAGAGSESGLLLAESPEEFAEARATLPESDGNAFPLLHPRAYRLPAEASRHKVLDLLGDLALGGRARGLMLPRLRLTIVNGGHALNHLFLDALAREGAGSETLTPGGSS